MKRYIQLFCAKSIILTLLIFTMQHFQVSVENKIKFNNALAIAIPPDEPIDNEGLSLNDIVSGGAPWGDYSYQGGLWYENPTSEPIPIGEVIVYGRDLSHSRYAPILPPSNWPSIPSDIWRHTISPDAPWSYWDVNAGGGTGGWKPASSYEPDTTDPSLKDTWDYHTNLRIATLADCLQGIIRSFINTMESEHGIQLRVTSAYRSIEDQNELYAQSRTQAELDEVGLSHVVARPDLPWVTNAIGGHSYHNHGLAIDVVEIKDGQALWENPNWNIIGSFGESLGLTWGASFNDRPHFQLDQLTISELLNGTDPCN